MNALPVIAVRKGEGRRAKAGAPWVFSNEIVMDGAAKGLRPGTLVRLQARGGDLGVGYFNPKSLIAVRLLAPPGTVVDAAFLADRIARALRLRERLYGAPFYRLVHAEGDFCPGLVVDRFGDTCVVQVTTAGMELLLPDVLAALDAIIAPERVILRNDMPTRALEGLDSYVRTAKGEASSRVVVEMDGARFFADPGTGQKSGWYYDQRDNRRFVARLAAGAQVLDAYCYSGGFGILAAVKGAAQVTLLDSSEHALTLAREAAAANGVADRCQFRKCDVFEELQRLAETGERFDIVIADPPPFARSKKDVESAARAYRKLARLAASVAAPGGFLMLASCSHNMAPDRFASECAAGIARAGKVAALIRQAGAGPDHPVHPMLPETAYLKAMVYAIGL
jgi:23S rRNA (cytosine1962-C5)-methyltransferase